MLYSNAYIVYVLNTYVFILQGFQQILNGEYDHLPEVAFYMVGPIEEVVQKAEKLAESTN